MNILSYMRYVPFWNRRIPYLLQVSWNVLSLILLTSGLGYTLSDETDYTFKPIRNNYLEDSHARAYGSILSKCEFYALRYGSEIADVFNAPDLHDTDSMERVSQDFIVENVGFAPWIAEGLSGTTLTGKDSRQVHEQGKWRGQKKVDSSPYAILNHKWIYMLGDSTTRQIWASYAAPFRENNFERNAKEWTRHYCNKQEHRKHHPKNGHFDDEGWRGPCGVNEVTCHVSGYGYGGLLTFDWKHFPFEDYDEFFWDNSTGPWFKESDFRGENRRPDLLTIQFGLHSCWHAVNEGLYSTHLNETNHKMIAQHKADIWKLMAAVRQSVDHQRQTNPTKYNHTTVIVLTSGGTGYGLQTIKTDVCVQEMNRITTDAAHTYGFAVLDRGEIERRFMYKSLFSDNPLFPNEMHLLQPVQNIIATTLLHLYSCIDHYNLSRSQFDEATKKKYPLERKIGFRNYRHGVLHVPQQ